MGDGSNPDCILPPVHSLTSVLPLSAVILFIFLEDPLNSSARTCWPVPIGVAFQSSLA
jgi:hypothetical protein